MRHRQNPFGTVLVACSVLLSSCGVGHTAEARTAVPHHTVMSLSPARYVNPLIGTSGNGNVVPGASAPFGMVQWGPDTSAGGLSRPGGYAYGDRIITGFSMTHLSGAGCVAYGNLPFMPTMRPISRPPLPNGSPYSDRFDHAYEHASPGYYDVQLGSGIEVQLTVTPRTGFGTFTFPTSHAGTIIVNAGGGAGGRLNTDGAIDSLVRIIGRRQLSGWVRGGHFCNLGNRYTLYFAADFDRPFASTLTWQGPVVRHGSRSARGPRAGAALTFDTHANRRVLVKIGLSYVSARDAQLNLGAEDPGWRFDAVRSNVQESWNRLLNRIQVTGGTASGARVFYTALYHAFLHPNIFSDSGGRYIGFDGRIHHTSRTQYANFSGWDIYRSEVQLLAWLLPREAADMMQSLVADAEQSGWLPKWPVANADTSEMNGDSADPMLADALAFGAGGFAVSTAFRFMLKGATQAAAGRGGSRARPGLRDYLRLGYIPGYNPYQIRPYGAAATTLEYAVDDFSIAQVAGSLGDSRRYAQFLRRSHTWRQLFNPATGLIEPRMRGGRFPVPFHTTSTDGYVEGNALQYTWMVPHDLPTLFKLMGGNRTVVERLNPLFTRLNGGPTDPYDWTGNEPGFGLPWEYDFAGAPWRTQAVVRQIMTNRYTTSFSGLPGNDDLGAMSSWYVWAAMGIYPEIPGVAGLALGSPAFPHILISAEDGKRLRIDASGAGSGGVYVHALRLNGRSYGRAWLPLSRLGRSGTLAFTLGSSPSSRWGTLGDGAVLRERRPGLR